MQRDAKTRAKLNANSSIISAKSFSCSAPSAGRVFSDAMTQPKIGTTGLKGTPQQILLGTAHTSGVRQDEEPRLFRDAMRLKTRFQFLSTTFCVACENYVSTAKTPRMQSLTAKYAKYTKEVFNQNFAWFAWFAVWKLYAATVRAPGWKQEAGAAQSSANFNN